MSARFRIRTKEGQEISFASHEVFAEFVLSGELSPDDVVYDAETREWSSALTHPVVLQLETDAAEVADAAADAAGTEATGTEAEAAPDDLVALGDASGAAAGLSYSMDLDLAPAPVEPTPEEEAAAFVARMQAERASERDPGEEAPLEGIRMEKRAASVVEELAGSAPEPSPPPRRRGRSRRKEAPTAVPAAAPKRKPKPRVAWKYAPFAILALAAVAGGVYFGPELLAPATSRGGGDGSEVSTQPPTPAPLIPDTEEALRSRARERFLTTTQAALRGLPPIPDIWLRGAYLAEPSDYPSVRETWQQYLETIRSVRAGEVQRYREAYLRALDDARVEGGARTLRLTSAVAAFQAAGAARAAHYDRVEALAEAALRGHRALVDAEGTILYQPATGPALSADPVIEAVGRSPQAQALLNQVLDVILAALHAERGPDESRNVREWVWTGLLDAVTS